MRRICFFNKITLFFFALAFITSCNAQDSTSLQKDNTAKPKITREKLPKIVKKLGKGGVVFCAIEDRAGNLWFGTHNEGVFCYDGDSFTNFTTKDGLNSNGVSCIIQDRAGNILFGTGKGISRYDPSAEQAGGKSFIDITQNTALRHSSIYTMFEDKKGRLWVSDYKDGYFNDGDYRGGIYLYDGSAEQRDGEVFTYFLSIDSVKNDDGLGLLLINEILEDPAGNIWFAGQNWDGVTYYDGKSLVQYESREKVDYNGDVYRSMILDKKGNLWLGTHARGVLRSVPAEDRKGEKLLPAGKASFIDITENTGLSNSAVMSMMEDKNGNIWFCTDGQGAWRYDGTSFKNFTTEDGLINNSVFSVVEDKKGNLWFGTRNVGLCRYNGKSFVNFSE